jgi:hypothetical protein
VPFPVHSSPGQRSHTSAPRAGWWLARRNPAAPQVTVASGF